MKRFLILVAITVPVLAQMNGVSGERIRAHVKFLSSDLLEGRGPGARGGDLAAEYLATQLALIGAKPAGDQERTSRTSRWSVSTRSRRRP
jgi:hypothetical protein